MTTIFTSGTYDIVHPGHIDFLKKCNEVGEVVVGLNSDDYVKRKKGKLPVMCYEEREAVLSGLRWVVKVVPNEDEHIEKRVLSNRANIIAIGSEWVDDDFFRLRCVSPEWLKDHGVMLLLISTNPELHSSSIKKRIL